MSDTEDNKRCSESDNEYDPQFKPIISLPEVEVLTNEENEEELLKIRAKLYRFDGHSIPKEWKERGTGDLKILHNRDCHSIRVVMRRDKTLKVCANHFLTPMIELKPMANNEKAFIYQVQLDFADEQPKSELFAIKFGTVENARLFKKAFEEGQEILRTQCKLYNGQSDPESDSDQYTDDDEKKIIEVKAIEEKVTEIKNIEEKENDDSSNVKIQKDETNESTKQMTDQLSKLDVSKEISTEKKLN